MAITYSIHDARRNLCHVGSVLSSSSSEGDGEDDAENSREKSDNHCIDASKHLKKLIRTYPFETRHFHRSSRRRIIPNESLSATQIGMIQDDFYLNLLDWGLNSLIAVASGSKIVVLKANRVQKRKEDMSSQFLVNESESLDVPSIAQGIELCRNSHSVPSTSPTLAVTPGRCHVLGPDASQQTAESRRTETLGERTMDTPSPVSQPAANFQGDYTSVKFHPTVSHCLACGNRDGDIELWDLQEEKIKYEIKAAHAQRIGVLSWINDDCITSGSRDRAILVHDIRCNQRLPIQRYDKHKQEVCGLAWKSPLLESVDELPPDEASAEEDDIETDDLGEILDAEERAYLARKPFTMAQSKGQIQKCIQSVLGPDVSNTTLRSSVPILASGGNDNKVYIWEFGYTSPVTRLCAHLAAVKALSWAPGHRPVLATGGGTNDRTIRIWDIGEKKQMCVCETESQVCNIYWCPRSLEMVSTHGYTLNQINVWDFGVADGRSLALRKLATLSGHTSRVLYMAASPDGSKFATAAGEAVVRVWGSFSETSTKPVIEEDGTWRQWED